VSKLAAFRSHLEPKFQGSSLGTYFGFYKTRHILLSDSASCTVLRAVVLTQYRRVTDRRTDRRNCRSKYTACNASIAARCKNGANFSASDNTALVYHRHCHHSSVASRTGRRARLLLIMRQKITYHFRRRLLLHPYLACVFYAPSLKRASRYSS